MKFEFATANRIIFGHHAIKEVGPIAADMGHRVCIVTGRTPGRAEQLVEDLKTRGLRTFTFSVPGEPTTATVLGGVEQARQAGSDLVIGIGGGSVLDTGKAIAALLINSGNLLVIPAWSGRQLWFTINSENLTPGIWKAKVRLKSLDVKFVETELEVSIKIWDVPLAKEQPLKFCVWSGTTKPNGTFDDQIAHGINLFTSTI